MAVIAQFPEEFTDPLLAQVERIFCQRKSRYQQIDRDILGDPGWDMLIYACMANRKAMICDLESLVA